MELIALLVANICDMSNKTIQLLEIDRLNLSRYPIDIVSFWTALIGIVRDDVVDHGTDLLAVRLRFRKLFVNGDAANNLPRRLSIDVDFSVVDFEATSV